PREQYQCMARAISTVRAIPVTIAPVTTVGANHGGGLLRLGFMANLQTEPRGSPFGFLRGCRQEGSARGRKPVCQAAGGARGPCAGQEKRRSGDGGRTARGFVPCHAGAAGSS